jgi:hypothetical protein
MLTKSAAALARYVLRRIDGNGCAAIDDLEVLRALGVTDPATLRRSIATLESIGAATFERLHPGRAPQGDPKRRAVQLHLEHPVWAELEAGVR